MGEHLSLIKALESLDSYKDFIPIDTTHHLWFLYYLSFMIIIAFLIDKIFDKLQDEEIPYPEN